MPEKKPLSDQQLRDCLRTHYGIQVDRLTPLSLGADMHASVYQAEAQDGSSFFVKLKRGHKHDIGVRVVELLDAAGIKEIIPPIQTKHHQPTCQIEDFTLIVYPFVRGEDGFHRSLSDAQWIKLGKTLRRIHEMDLPLLIKSEIRRETYSSKWREIVRSLYSHIENKPKGDDIALNLSAFMKVNEATVNRLVDRAEQLASLIQSQSPQFVLCHSDIHGGNVLLTDDNGIFIVDWDDPIMAPKERDLMFIGGGVANMWNRPHEEELFYKGYGNTTVNEEILAYYRHERIVEDIAEYGQALLLTAAGGFERAIMYRHFMNMFEPGDVVEIAFKTDEAQIK